MATCSHNHRRKLIRRCRKEAGGDRKKGYELFRLKVAEIVNSREGAPISMEDILIPS